MSTTPTGSLSTAEQLTTESSISTTSFTSEKATTTMTLTPVSTTTMLTTTITTEITTATPTPVPNTSVLILSTYKEQNKPILTDSNGKVEANIFQLGNDTEVSLSCAVTFQDKFYLYGGSSEKTQISRIEGCSLKRVGDLAFDVVAAGCTVSNDTIYLCFGKENEQKTCHSAISSKGPFATITESKQKHGYTRIASSPSLFLTFGFYF